MRNLEQKYLEKIIDLYDCGDLPKVERDFFLEFYEYSQRLSKEYSLLIEKMENLEEENFELKRDNEILRDELDKF